VKIKMLRTVKVAKGAHLLGERVYSQNDLPGGVDPKQLIKEGAAIEVPEGTPRGEGPPTSPQDRVSLRDVGIKATENIPEESKRKFAQDEGVDFQERDFAEYEEGEEEVEHEEEDPATKERRKVKKVVKVKKKKSRS
jgi:hypothetical protein